MIIISLYNTILYQPLFNLLVYFYNIIPLKDVGWAIILLTIVIRVILYPLSKKSIESQKRLQTLKPQIDELKQKHRDNKEAFGRASMELYKKEKINPASSCLPLLLQFPILIAVYQVFRNGLTNGSFDLLYPFISHPGEISHMFLGLINLSEPNIILAVITGISQYIQSKMILNIKGDKPATGSGKGDINDIAGAMSKQMVYIMPLFTIFIGISLPSGLVLYWLVSTVFTVAQQYLVFRKKTVQTVE